MADTKIAVPIELTDAELDAVAAGALIDVVAVDVVDVENNNVAVSVPVNAAVAAFDSQAVATQGRPGRIRQE